MPVKCEGCKRTVVYHGTAQEPLYCKDCWSGKTPVAQPEVKVI